MMDARVNPTIADLQLKPLLDALRDTLGDGLLGVVLYGSHARGTARPDSDIDLLVIAESLPEGRPARSEFFVRLQFEAGYTYARASILGKTVAEFERTFPALFLDIGLDGLVLFDSHEYVSQRLARIRSVTREAGLVRQPLNGEFVWKFSHPIPPPPGFWILDWEGYREFTG